MKHHAQAILQFTGYPLEPIVALHVNKTYQSQAIIAFSNPLPLYTETVQRTGFVYKADDVDERWFSGYE